MQGAGKKRPCGEERPLAELVTRTEVRATRLGRPVCDLCTCVYIVPSGKFEFREICRCEFHQMSFRAQKRKGNWNWPPFVLVWSCDNSLRARVSRSR